ncbi:MAG: ester cyclase [Ktedonobacteraceae bacterium]
MSTEDNKALARRYIEEVFNQKNLALVDELNTPDFVLHNASMTIQGREPYKQYLSMLLTAFPDMHISIEDMIAEGDIVTERVTIRSTHKGDYMGIPPTGKQATMTAIYIIRFTNGKGVEVWANSDDLGAMQQLGVIPTPG